MLDEHTPSLDYLAGFISDGGGLAQVQAADKRLLEGGVERCDCDRRNAEIVARVARCGFVPIKPTTYFPSL